MNNKFRLVFTSIVAIAIAIFLLVKLVDYLKINLIDFQETILHLPIWGLVLFLLMTLFNLMIGAKKWKMVMDHLPTDIGRRPGYWFYLTYTTLGAFIGLFVPIQLSTLVVRSISIRLGGYGSLQKGAVTSVASQFQDVLMIAFFFIPGLFVLLGKSTNLIWLISVFSLIVAGFIFFKIFALQLANKIFSTKIADNRHKVASVFQEIANKRLLDPSLTIPLFRLSLLRFLNLALRSYLISWLVGLNVSLVIIMSVSSITQLSLLISITPGNLGLLEWGWVGLLGLVGVSVLDAGHFALIMRLLGYGSTFLIFMCIFFYFFLWVSKKRQYRSQPQPNTK